MRRRHPVTSSATPASRGAIHWRRSRWYALRSLFTSRTIVLAAVALFALASVVSISARVDAADLRDRGSSTARVAVLPGGPRPLPVPELPAPGPGPETLLRGEGTPTPTTVAVAPHADGPSWDPSPSSLSNVEILRNPGERRAQVRKVVRR